MRVLRSSRRRSPASVRSLDRSNRSTRTASLRAARLSTFPCAPARLLTALARTPSARRGQGEEALGGELLLSFMRRSAASKTCSCSSCTPRACVWRHFRGYNSEGHAVVVCIGIGDTPPLSGPFPRHGCCCQSFAREHPLHTWARGPCALCCTLHACVVSTASTGSRAMRSER